MQLSKLGEDITETLEVVPRQWKVIQTVRESFCAGNVRRLRAAVLFHVTPRGFAGPNLLAMILFEKFGQHKIENVAGSNHADLLIGNGAANRLEGWGGNDVITAGNGTDVLFGHDGNESLNGGLGNDVLEGGSGVDWALYNTGLGSGITIDLFSETQVAGGGGVDTLRDIENVMATGYADSPTGNNLANELRGEAGNDAIWGNGGAECHHGGIGDDAIAGGTGADTMIGGSGNDHIWGGGENVLV